MPKNKAPICDKENIVFDGGSTTCGDRVLIRGRNQFKMTFMPIEPYVILAFGFVDPKKRGMLPDDPDDPRSFLKGFIMDREEKMSTTIRGEYVQMRHEVRLCLMDTVHQI